MNETVRAQILAIRETGETNMFDVPAVRRIAVREEYAELLDYLAQNTPDYATFILYGEGTDERRCD